MTNPEQIEKQAKHLMDTFLRELAAVPDDATFGLRREKQMREPRACEPDETFRKAFFANAPVVRDDLLIAEKKQW